MMISNNLKARLLCFESFLFFCFFDGVVFALVVKVVEIKMYFDIILEKCLILVSTWTLLARRSVLPR